MKRGRSLTCAIILLALTFTLALSSCEMPIIGWNVPPVQPTDEFVVVNPGKIEPTIGSSSLEKFPLRNCGTNSTAEITVGEVRSITKKTTVGATMTGKVSGTIDVPPAVKAGLEVAIGTSYQQEVAEAKSRSYALQFSQGAGSIYDSVYWVRWDEMVATTKATIKWKNEEFIIPYSYSYTVPTQDGSANSLNCGGKDFSGFWLTPLKSLTYRITQKNDKYTWKISQTGIVGDGTISKDSNGNEILTTVVVGETVVYFPVEFDGVGDPTVLFTLHPKYFGVVFFRTCGDYEKFLNDLKNLFPEQKDIIEQMVKNTQDPTCPT